jgi:two-component system, LytTR family, response regulator
VKILIVDNEAHGRDNLIRLCNRRDDIQEIAEAACGRAAIDTAVELKPDVVLLDVELPDMSGFDLLQAVRTDAHPVGIMVANCADHAFEAFAEGAIDYLMTPVTSERFDRAMARAHHQFDRATPANQRLPARPLDSSHATTSPRFLVGERQHRLYPLDPQLIDYIEADGNYVTLRAGKVEYLGRDSLKRLTKELADLGFIRIERSLMMNAAAVSYVEVAGNGTFAFTLRSGVCLHSGVGYRDSILRVIPLPRRYRCTA